MSVIQNRVQEITDLKRNRYQLYDLPLLKIKSSFSMISPILILHMSSLHSLALCLSTTDRNLTPATRKHWKHRHGFLVTVFTMAHIQKEIK